MTKQKNIDYSKGKIYKLVSDKTKKVYIGSTTKKHLCSRMASHVWEYSKYLLGERSYITSYEIIKHGDAKIFLLEQYPYNSKDELIARERHWIESTDSVNKYIPGRTQIEYRIDNADKLKEYKKNYYVDNFDRIKDNQKKYRIANADNIRTKKKEYSIKNADKLKEYKKNYYVDNFDKIKDAQKQYYNDNKKRIKDAKSNIIMTMKRE